MCLCVSPSVSLCVSVCLRVCVAGIVVDPLLGGQSSDYFCGLPLPALVASRLEAQQQQQRQEQQQQLHYVPQQQYQQPKAQKVTHT